MAASPHHPFSVRVALAIVRLVRFLVPHHLRQDWRREWEAEIQHRWTAMADRHETQVPHQATLVRRSTGALADAASLRARLTAELSVVQDVRHAVRVLQRRPVVSALAVVALALGIGGTVVVYSVVDTLLVRRLPYAETERVVTIWQTSRDNPRERDGVAPGAFLDWRERVTVFDRFAAAEPLSFRFLDGPEPISFIGAGVTEGFFEALGVQPLIGRLFLPDEYTPGRSDVVLLNHGTWQRFFGGDPHVVGQHVGLAGRPHLIAGVLPPWFHPDVLRRAREQEIWAPNVVRDFEFTDRRNRYWSVVGRLAPGISIEQAQAELKAISVQLADEYPRTLGGMTATLVPFRRHLADPIRDPLTVLFGAVVLVLLLACANVASLLLARGVERRHELAIRTAIGANRWRLVRQSLVESGVLAALACVLAIVVAYSVLRALVPFASIAVPQLSELSLDGRLLIVSMGVATAAAILTGLWPALHLSKTAPQSGLRDTAAGLTTSARRRFAWSALVVSEVALALTLLTGAGLLIRSFVVLAGVDPGFARFNVAVLQVFAYGERYANDQQRLTFFDQTLDRLRAIPGVMHAGVVSAMPLLPANIDIRGGYRVEGHPSPPDAELPVTSLTVATTDYFQAMGIPLRRGRFFTDADHANAPRVALVNELFARQAWSHEDPVDQRIAVNWQGQWRTLHVVGVIGSVRHTGLDGDPRPEVFMPLAQVPFGSMTFVVRTAGPPDTLVPALKARIWEGDPTLPLYDTTTMDALVDQALAPRLFVTRILGAMAGLAFVLAVLGVYGVLNFTTLQRTREIGVRIAFGGSRAGILAMVVRDGMWLVAVGLLVGLLATLAATRMLATLLYQVSPTDPLTLGMTTALLATVALLACAVPAIRATRVDPLVALRST